MAKKTKKGLYFFYQDTDSSNKTIIRLLTYKHGLLGYGIYYRFLETIYGLEGYYMDFDDELQEIFTYDNRISLEELSSTLEFCIKHGIFDADMYKKYQILTSKDIQKYFIEATISRKRRIICNDYWLLTNPSAEEAKINNQYKPYTWYKSYLNSAHWINTRARIISQRGYQCEKCGSYLNVQVHHLTYKNLGNEKDRDLMVLCEKCHQLIHNNK